MESERFADSKLLTIVLVYAAVLHFGITHWWPVSTPTYIDAFRLSVLVLFITRIAVTYAYAKAAREYEMDMFLLELVVASLFCAQLSVLAEPQAAGWEFLVFYILQIFLGGSMFAWSAIGQRQVSVLGKVTRYLWSRLIAGFLLPLVGVVIEILSLNSVIPDLYVKLARWGISLSLLVIAVIYLRSKPWNIFRAPEG